MSPVRLLSALFLALGLHAPTLAFSQSPSEMNLTANQPISESVPTSTHNQDHSISIDVVTVDKADAPVTGLKPEDFTVFDNNQRESIASVQAVGITNAPEETPVEVILAIDAINTSIETVIQECDWLHQYLDRNGKQLNLPTSFAFLDDPKTTMQNYPTRDTAALGSFLDSNRAALRTLRRSGGFWGFVERKEISLNGLDTLVAQAQKRPGRKLLVWIGPGWGEGPDPNERAIGKSQQALFSSIVAVSDQLRKARITLDMIDPTISGDRIFNFNYKPFVKGVSKARDANYGHLMLPVLAVQSGGQVLYGSTDLPGLIERSLADAGPFYVVTYNPPPTLHASEYHAVEIKIDRPGVVARTRTGYYAQTVGDRGNWFDGFILIARKPPSFRAGMQSAASEARLNSAFVAARCTGE